MQPQATKHRAPARLRSAIGRDCLPQVIRTLKFSRGLKLCLQKLSRRDCSRCTCERLMPHGQWLASGHGSVLKWTCGHRYSWPQRTGRGAQPAPWHSGLPERKKVKNDLPSASPLPSLVAPKSPHPVEYGQLESLDCHLCAQSTRRSTIQSTILYTL